MNEPKKSHDNEDIAGLFSAFGGDVAQYQEFKPAADAAAGPGWPLLDQLAGAPARAASGMADAAPAPTPGPAHQPAGHAPLTWPEPASPAPAPAAAALPPLPIPAAMHATAPAGPTPPPTALSALFDRLAAAPAEPSPGRHGLLAHWRHRG
ncbi:hypothetical protein PGB34_04780 [Xenophilus arseniciresistens]|uniref:Cellulose biosynthesis protein BcsR n=1 Tax=Xenophilus arseniciresistens TaxID=1283306 RepID=A0AAE3SYN0_9BURK|nr:BcsR/BcsP family cellulose biosynthesis protein [Xenophilus arseniciresistens]MDA7415670.1 hypothetical protein [Xenophilus arseniciresistens]